MKKCLDAIKKFWRWFTTLVATKEFVFTFPMAIFATVALVLHSLLMAIVFGIWMVTIFCQKNEEN